MKIAITTWHSGPNAGTFFQLYGLFMYLKSRGHQVEVVNYDHIDKDFLPRGWYYYTSQPLYNPQIEMFARFKMKSSFHKTKRII